MPPEMTMNATLQLEPGAEQATRKQEPGADEATREPEPGADEAELLRQFRRLFAPILDDSLQLYYKLNEGATGDTEHIRIHQTVAQLNEQTSSEEEATVMTQVNSPSPPVEVELLLPLSSCSSTSSSSLYAIHTPSPAHPSDLPPNLDSPLLSCSESRTITEQVQLHNPPQHLNEDENNTSCSLSSNLTDSKTLDGRTPIVV